MGIIRTIAKLFKSPSLWEGLGVGFLLLTLSCTKEETEAGEWDNWQQRNEAFFASLADSLNTNPNQWQRILSFSQSAATTHDIDKYIYVKKLENGEGGESPAYTDSVRVIYQGSAYSQCYLHRGLRI